MIIDVADRTGEAGKSEGKSATSITSVCPLFDPKIHPCTEMYTQTYSLKLLKIFNNCKNTISINKGN